jgi:CubicO group peptidase (beta-lactamase class C family)
MLRSQRDGFSSLTRRQALMSSLGLAGAAGWTHVFPGSPGASTRLALPLQQATPAATPASQQAADILALASDALATHHLKAVILRVLVDGEEIVTAAFGESMTGVPATTDMHFRNGAVAIAYMTTLLLLLVDDGAVTLDDTLATWLSDLPDAEQVTLRMLANMTSGYPDYVQNPQFVTALYADPFRAWTADELLDLGLALPRSFAPGTNWAYAHTNYVILGRAMEKITGQPLAELLQTRVLDPLGLTNTTSSNTADIPPPVLHAFTSERREIIGVPPGTRFYEESTYWNPSWTLAPGAIQTTNIVDLAASAIAIGEGTLLSPASHQAQIAPDLLGFGSPVEGCPTCATMEERYNYGLGVVLSGSWILQNPLFAGCGAVMAYLPSKKLAIAVATTFAEKAFDDQGNNPSDRASWTIFADIATLLAPDEAPATNRS